MSSELALTGVDFKYPGASLPTVDDVALTVSQGSCVGVLGPSGSGKSTLLRLIAGLETPDSGDIQLGGSSILDRAPERRGVGMVFQKPLLFPHRSVVDNVGFGLRMSGRTKAEARETANDFLDLVQLLDFADRAVSTLSGGQAQRVALARALAVEPSVLLLDEPFSALDVRLREEMYDLLLQIRERLSPTVVLVTHDQREVALLCESVAIMMDGAIKQQGTMDEIYRRPATLAVSRLLGGLNEIPGRVVSGVHESAWGQLRLPVADLENPVGPDQDPVADGPSTLVIRQESVLLCRDLVGAERIGVVRSIRATGMRQLVTVLVGEQLITGECDLRTAWKRGDEVSVQLPLSDRTVVPGNE